MDKKINLNILDSQVNLLDLDFKNIQLFLASIGAKNFTAEQIIKWIYSHNCYDFDKMSNISKNIKKKAIPELLYKNIKFFRRKSIF